MNELKQAIIQSAKKIEEYIIQTRRHIHKHPETSFEEEKTATFIEEELTKIGLEPIRIAKTGIMCIIEGKSGDGTIALRADIDALNIQEENEKEYKSQNPGKMHACGHDGHTAALLGAAHVLVQFKDKIKGKIKLIFQPAEEGGGGGKIIVDEGHLNDVDEIFGIHLWQELPAGTIGLRKGGFLASADEFTITITGKGGHAASPHLSIDPTSVLIDIYNALQKLISREINPFADVVLTTPVLIGSDAFNVIPTKAAIKGTLRTYDSEIRSYILERMETIIKGYAKAWRCTGGMTLDKISYPPLINHDESVDKAKKILSELDEVQSVDPSLGGEDFAFYLQKTKGAFLALGIKNEEKGVGLYPHHHPKFDIDEEVLWKATAIYSLLGLSNTFIKSE